MSLHETGEKLSELSKYLEFRRGADLEEDSYVYHLGKWLEILEVDDRWARGDIAGAPRYQDQVIHLEPDRLYVTIPADSPIWFRNGQPCEELWPGQDLIYVEEAYPRTDAGPSVSAGEKMHGLFLRRYGPEEGSSYYTPLSPEEQEVPRTWILDPDTTLLMSWRPVFAAEILKAVGK